jgi:hypothetical protein
LSARSHRRQLARGSTGRRSESSPKFGANAGRERQKCQSATAPPGLRFADSGDRSGGFGPRLRLGRRCRSGQRLRRRMSHTARPQAGEGSVFGCAAVAGEAQPPQCVRHDACAAAFDRDPLDEATRGADKLAAKANADPCSPWAGPPGPRDGVNAGDRSRLRRGIRPPQPAIRRKRGALRRGSGFFFRSRGRHQAICHPVFEARKLPSAP